VSRLGALFWSDLARHVYRKIALVVPLLVGVATLIFLLVELSPGTAADKYIDPSSTSPEAVAALTARFHLDQPAWVRWVYLMRNLATFDFGDSLDQGRPVSRIILESLPNTILLSTVTLLVIYPVGMLLGAVQGTRRGRPEDTAISVGSLFLYSMPGFWLAMMLQLFFGYELPILPITGMHDDAHLREMSAAGVWIDLAKHIVLPGVAMGLAYAAGVARYMRSSFLEVLGQDYIRTARAKGLSEARVLGVHALRNSLLPIITVFGLSLPMVFSGSEVIEAVFAWPGMGTTIVGAIFSQDTPLIVGCFVVYALVVAFGNLLADVLYAVVDPRIRYS
jgi:peptide/nickel transport system permease protein